MTRVFSLLLLSLALGLTALAQTLPRKAYHGGQLKPDSGGIRVLKVLPGGTMEAAGMQDGDLLLAVNGKPVTKSSELIALGLLEGQKAAYQFRRAGSVRSAKATVKAKAKEVWPKGEVQYVAVPFGKDLLRGIVNKPAGPGPFPTVLFIQGYTCSPVCDAPDWHPYRRIAEGLAERGYAVLRVEKPGMGESAGPTHCEDMDLVTEAAAFEAGLNWLEAQPYAGKGKSYIYGHSLGGIVAPMIAEHHKLSGVAVYGTLSSPWFEYLLYMLRSQGPNMGQDYIENERNQHLYQKLLYHMMVEYKTPKEVIVMDTAYERLLKRDFDYDGGRRLLGRDVSTFWDLNRVDFTSAWAKTACPVLGCYGTADIEALNAEGVQTIAAIVNRYHPGNGSYRLLEGVNHAFAQVGSMKAEYEGQDPATKQKRMQTSFDPVAITSFTDWVASLPK